MTKQQLNERIKQQPKESTILIELADETRHNIDRISKDGNAVIIHVNDEGEDSK